MYHSLVCLTLMYLHSFVHFLLANKWAHWSNIAWAACLGHAKLALCHGASSWTTVCHQGGMLKDATAGFVSIQTSLLLAVG